MADETRVKLGTNLPEHLILEDPGALREFLRAIEDMGYGYITVGDHVLGADLDPRPDWKPYFGHGPLYDRHMVWHEPFVLFGWLSAFTETLELCTGILVGPQRQSALLAKQAAEVDLLSGGRTRFVIAAGWNDVEFEGMGVDFKKRGKIMDEQLDVLKLLWTQEVVNYHGEHHTLDAVGINPLPIQRPIPVWLGGQSPRVLKRVGRQADGWFPYYPWFSEDLLREHLETIHTAAKEAGRDPSEIGLEGAVYFEDERFEMPPGARKAPKTMEECVEYAHLWKSLGATRYWVTAPWADLGPEETGVREPGKEWSGIEPRLRELEAFKKALGDDF